VVDDSFMHRHDQPQRNPEEDPHLRSERDRISSPEHKVRDHAGRQTADDAPLIGIRAAADAHRQQSRCAEPEGEICDQARQTEVECRLKKVVVRVSHIHVG
jgi:hypothetical protein